MSAYICNEKTYADIYSGLRKFYVVRYSDTQSAIERLYEFTSNDFFADDHGVPAVSQLYALNVEAVNLRYNETYDDRLTNEQMKAMFVYQPELTIHQFLKSLECLRYQMSQDTIPQKSALYGHISELIAAICRDIVHSSKLYSEAEWG